MLRKWIASIGLLCTVWLGLQGTADAAKVIIDPGHGGRDPGAISTSGLKEKDVNLDVSLKLRNELLARGYEVAMTRDTDRFMTLQERIQLSNGLQGDILVSVHANSHTNANYRGSLVLYYDNRQPQPSYPASAAMIRHSAASRSLAASIQDELSRAAGTINIGIVPSSAYMVRMGTIPSVLVETAFLSNEADVRLLASEQIRQAMAVGIARGIEAQLPASFRDLAGHWAREPVSRLKSLQVVQGYGQLYMPDRALTRAEFIAMMERAEPRAPYEAEPPGGNAFSDVPPRHWAHASIVSAASRGKLQGFPDGSFRPDAPVSRAEMAAFVNRYARLDLAAPGQTGFRDVPAAHWAYEDISQLRASGLIQGRKEGLYAPHDTVTRAEMAAVLDRYLNGSSQL